MQHLKIHKSGLTRKVVWSTVDCLLLDTQYLFTVSPISTEIYSAYSDKSTNFALKTFYIAVENKLKEHIEVFPIT